MTEYLRTETKECTLDVTTDYSSPAQLHVRYKVHNRSSLPVYLFNKLYGEIQPGKVFEVNQNIVHIRSEDSGVIISKAIVPVPGGLEVEYRYVPCMTKLLPDGSFEESFYVPLPVSPYSAYTPWLLRHVPDDRKLFFEVGYFAAVPQAENLIREVATPDGTAYRIDPFSLSSQMLLTVGPFERPIQIFTAK